MSGSGKCYCRTAQCIVASCCKRQVRVCELATFNGISPLRSTEFQVPGLPQSVSGPKQANGGAKERRRAVGTGRALNSRQPIRLIARLWMDLTPKSPHTLIQTTTWLSSGAPTTAQQLLDPSLVESNFLHPHTTNRVNSVSSVNPAAQEPLQHANFWVKPLCM